LTLRLKTKAVASDCDHMSSADINLEIDRIYRAESRRVFATLMRLLGDFDLAEEALHEAFRAAVEQWPTQGVPTNPSAWLISAGRFKGVDTIRRQARFTPLDDVAEFVDGLADASGASADAELLEDDRLRLIFTCCHPTLSEDAQVALTLREVCGLTTEEIAHAYLMPAPTLAQRIVRAKAKIRDAKIPYVVPARDELAARLETVLRVVYLVFNEGYSPSSGESVTRADLSGEAIRLLRLIATLLPQPEVCGLLALMLLHESRRAARTDDNGDLVPLDEQDRGRWDQALIAEGVASVTHALSQPGFGAYSLQAAISAVHAEAKESSATDWAEIVGLYDELLLRQPSLIIALNRAVAIAMRDGPAAGLVLVDALLQQESMQQYHLAHAARADLCRRLGRFDDARSAYLAALNLTTQAPERRFIEKRLAALGRQR
jgi:RNA polymerase sigma-70 factor, ECF subfamily